MSGIDLSGRTALVTGASRGIGAATARALTHAGARVVLAARDERAMRAMSRDLPGAEFIVVDLADPDQIRMLADHSADVDILVNNAGVSWLGDTGQLTGPDFKQLSTVNVFAPLLLSGRIGAAMSARGRGVIVNVGSGLSEQGSPGSTVYAATKGAVAAATRGLASDLGPGGVRVNAVLPGPIDTDMTAALTAIPGAVQRLADLSALRRLATPGNVADVITFLASDASAGITGQLLHVDAGLSSTVHLIDPALLAAHNAPSTAS